MEAAPVTAATGAIGPVVEKLSTLLPRRGEYQLRRRTSKDVKLIRSKLKSVHSTLWVIWERVDLDVEGKKLRMEAWGLADDMNDAIDDFILTLKRSNDGRRFLEDKTQPNHRFEELKRRVNDVSERCRNKWKKETAHTTFCSLFSRTKASVDSGPAKRPRVHQYVHKDISELVRMEEPRDELIEHLVGEEENTPQLKMASILGAAGTGKTTLARLVYEAIKDKFEARAFVSITSCGNMKEVLASILQQVRAHSIPVAATRPAAAERRLVDNISSFLKDKRYLVMIDDIWHYGEWKTINKSLPDNNRFSRIVTTSRVKSITEMWRDDCGALVCTMTGVGFDRRHGIVNDMCTDMPLAVACMISALAKERERLEEQEGLCVLTTPGLQDRIVEQVNRNGIQKTPGFEPLVESLELGYKDLPHHMLKTCLLYCSIYPKGRYFGRDDLASRWITEGFVCTEEAAKEYFDVLVSRGLIQELRSDGSDGDNCSYKLHPMMQNYLRWKLREDNFITCTSDGVPSSPVGRLCIDDNWPSSDLGLDWHHIRSLVILKGAERVPYKNLEHLRVLDVQYNGTHVLENRHLKEMCGMLRLRHLFVSGGACREEAITEMPAEIAMLQHLETLQVRETKITILPAEIGGLKQLKTLDVDNNGPFPPDLQLPREIGNLQHLETAYP